METAANSNVPMDMGRPGTVLLKNVIDIVMTIIAGRLTCKSVASTTNQPTTPRSPACTNEIRNAARARLFWRLSSMTADANCDTICMFDRILMRLSSGPTANSATRLAKPKTTPTAIQGKNWRNCGSSRAPAPRTSTVVANSNVR